LLLLLVSLLATASQAALLRGLVPEQRAAVVEQLQENDEASSFASMDDDVLPAPDDQSERYHNA
jgi:hypothetical protein